MGIELFVANERHLCLRMNPMALDNWCCPDLSNLSFKAQYWNFNGWSHCVIAKVGSTKRLAREFTKFKQ